MVRKFGKRSSLSQGEEPNNCALAYCRYKNAAENFDRYVTQTLCQMYSLQDLFQDSRIQCWSDSESGRETILASDSSSEFPRLEASLMVFVAGKKTAYFGSAQLIDVFFASKELLALAVVCSLVLVGQKRDPDKKRVVLCSCAGFVLLLADPSSPKSNSFIICSLQIGFVWTTPAMMPVFLRPFANALIMYLPGQRYWKTVCCAASCDGNDQWRL